MIITSMKKDNKVVGSAPYSKKSKTSKPTIPASQQVNRVGKYLYKHLDGAVKIKYSGNTCDVYTILLYQIPYLQRIPGKGKEYNDVHEMYINLNITTYQNKLRVNVIEITPEERTLGCDVYKPELLEDLEEAKRLIYQKVCKRLSKAYEEYDFLF